ncbi:MAG TPA: C25 family cysteine peptidase [Vicinamibacterales bacterium]
MQSGTAVNNANGIQTITISSVDTTKSVLFFQTRSSGNRPVNSEVRGRLQTATTIQFERVTDEAAPAAINIQWYVVTFGSGVNVQRGETPVSNTSTNVAITAVASLNQAFVLWSMTAASGDNAWGSDDQVLGELTTTTNLQFRANLLNAAHTVAWQVVEFTNAADINVQKGTTSLTGGATSTTVTLGTAVNTSKTFVLVGARVPDGTGPDIGSKTVRAQLTNSTTITIDRGASTADVTEIVWQAVELKDASTVWRGSANFAVGATQATAFLQPPVNIGRTVAFVSMQAGGGQNGGSTPYVGDDVPGVATATASLVYDTLTLTRNSTVSSADLGWFVVQFDGGSPFKVGSFQTSTATGAQTIAHGLGQVPKALILWTEGRTDQAFSTSTSIAFRSAAAGGGASGNLTITKPAGTALNDVMVAAVGVRPNTVTITPPAGWTLLRRTNNANPTAHSLAIYYKAAGAAEPANYSWTLSANTGNAGGISSFSGVDVNNPIDVDAGQNTAAALTHTAPSITTTKANTMIVGAFAMSSAASWTRPPAMAEALDTSSIVSGNGETVEMAYVAQAAIGASGTFTATASTDPDVGNTETLALVPARQAYFGFGMTDGTTSKSVSASSQGGSSGSHAANRVASKAITIVKWTPLSGQTVLAEADLQSWDSTNIVLNWTTNDSYQYVVHYLAIGGSDVSAKVVQWQSGTTTGNVAVTGVGFQPVLAFHAYANYQQTAAPNNSAARAAFGFGAMDMNGDQWAVSTFSRDGLATSDTQRGQVTDGCIYSFSQTLAIQKEASIVSMDADGFTVNFTNSTSATSMQVFTLALAGLNGSVGSFLKSAGAAPASQAVTGVNFRPSAVLLTSFQDVTQATPVTHSRYGIGASDGTTEGSSAYADVDAVTTTNVVGIDKTSKVFMKMNNSTPAIDAEADLSSMDADGFTLNWTTNDAVQTQILYFALAPLAATEVKLISFTATKYDRGNLLEWRTGYELDNLGFNLYREINGVRTKVNTSLIAGSGLMAGRGTAVTSQQRYARWDLTPGEGVSYWLEDLDFSGKATLHGPVVPVAGGLIAPDVQISTDVKNVGKEAKHHKVMFRRNEGFGAAQPGAWWSEPQAQIETQWALAGDRAIKIGIRAPGWYHVAQADLVAAGLDPRVDPRLLRLFVDGVEQSMRVIGEADGRFDSADAVEFYATGQDTPYTDAHVYWLVAGKSRGLRVGVSGPAAGEAVRIAATSFWSAVQRKDRSVYFAALKNGDAENWFGPIVSGDPTDLTLDLDNVEASAAAPAHVTVAVQGVTTASDGSAGHSIEVRVNGTRIGQLDFQGNAHHEQTFDAPLSAVLDGTNTVTLVALNGDVDLSLVDYVRISYPHAFRADADLLRFTVDTPGRVTVAGFASRSIHVVDITDPSDVSELRGSIVTDGSGSSSVSVRVQERGERVLLAYSDATAASPAYLQANVPSTWHLPTRAHDYLVIAHPDFVAAARPLIDRRTREGHQTALVSVDDIYDEFSYGEKTPQAIRDFLQWARSNWRLAPRFVVLLGDATIDPRDYAGMGDADFVPTKQVPMTQIALEAASDDWFVDFNDDGLPDIAIGRLSVRTVDQAQAMVAKIAGYGTGQAPAWTRRVLLVADRDDDTSTFVQYSRGLESVLPNNYTAREVFRDALPDAAAHQALVDAVNDGQLIVNYTGHGSSRIWGSNGELLTNESVAEWKNAGRLPLVIAMNCLNGLFDSIWDEESLAEALMRAPDGGAVAAWASSSVTPSSTQALVNAELFRLIFGSRFATVGEAIAAAKRAVTKPDLRRSWIFFGDPAMELFGVPKPIANPPASRRTPVVVEPSAANPPSPGSHNEPATAEQVAALDARPRATRLMDVNGDRRSDLFLYAPRTGQWGALVSGDTAAQSGMWAAGWQVAAADLNGDGRSDLVFVQAATSEWVQGFAVGNGTFVYTRGMLPAGAARGQMAVGDFSGDGRDDVLFYDSATGVWTIALSDGRGGFEYRRGAAAAGLIVHAVDLNGDRAADIFGYDSRTGNAIVLLANGDGRFQTSSTNLGPGWRVSIGRLDSGRRADLFLYNPTTGAARVAANNGAARFALRAPLALPAGLEIHVADLDGDRRDDLFGYNPATGVVVTALNRAAGDVAVSAGVWTTGFAVATGDLNGDGRDDVAIYDPATGIWFRAMSTGAGTFSFGSGSWLPDASLVGVPR